MPQLTKAMDEMLATIKDESAREILRKQLEGNDSVHEHFLGNMRQSDYDRNMNAQKADVENLRRQAAEAQTKAEEGMKWKKWAIDDKNVEKHETLLTDYAKLQKDKEALEAKNGGAGGAGGGSGAGAGEYAGMTETQILEKINGALSGRGFMTKPELDAAIKAAADARAKEFLDNTFSPTAAWMTTMNELQFKHRDEFSGKPLDTKGLSKFMVDNKIPNLEQAYDRYVSEDRSKLHEERLRKEIETDMRSKLGLPGTGSIAAPEIGPLQARLQGKPPVDIPDGTVAGDGRMASMAAQELRQEGKV